MIIAVDGPAASGKGTLSTGLAGHFNLPHLDTGLLYRAVGRDWLMFGNQADSTNSSDSIAHAILLARSPDASHLDEIALGTPEIGQAASKIATIPQVRQALLQLQHDFSRRPEGALLDGRDIGTVICPAADVKLFITADATVRADRRAAQLEARGIKVNRTELLADILARDARDSNRADAPLKMADDAHLLDTSQLGIEAALRAAIAIVDGAIENKAGR